MSKSLLRNTGSAPITLPPPYTGIIAPGDAVVLDDPPSVVVEAIGIVPELINFLVVTQVPDAQPVDGHDRGAAAEGIARALASLDEPLDLNGQRIVNVADPIDQQDVATKQYVDTHGGGGGGSVTSVSSANAYLTVTNGTTTPQLTVHVGTGATEVAAGTDSRFNPAPSVSGAVVYDTGAGYAKTAAGSTGQVLKVGSGGLPEWGSDSTAPSGPAGGSLAGTYPNPTIAADVITNTEVSPTAAIATSKLSGLVTDITGNGLAEFVSAQTQVARTYYVAVNGDDTNDGSLSKPFATLQAAHDEAPDDGTFVQIIVGPGDFAGNLNLTRRNTLIQGAGHRAEMFATKIVGSITVDPVNATNRNTDMVGLAGCFVSASSGAAAVKATGSALYSLILNDCYLYTNSASTSAAAFACDATNPARPRIIANECILATELAGPSIIQLDRGDARMDATQIRHNSGVTSGAAGNGITALNDATLWLNGSLVETRTRDAAISATGASAGVKLTLTNTGVTAAYAGAENTTHGITVGNTAGVAALLYQAAFNVADVSAGVYAINGTGAVVFTDVSYTYGTNSAVAPTIALLSSAEMHGTMNLPSLTASLPLKLNASKTVTAAAISLSGAEVTDTLPVGKGGTGISTTPPAGTVAYGNGSTQAYTAVGTTGQALISAGSGTPAFGALDLGTAGNITGTLPKGNQEAQDVGGDLDGTTAAATVTHIQSRPVDATAPTAGQVYMWSGSAWAPETITSGGGGSSGGGLTYYLNYDAPGDAPLPDLNTKQLSLAYSTGGQVNTGAVEAPQNSYATLAEFVTPLLQPGATTIAPGNWDIGAYLIPSNSTDTYFRARVYKWDGTTLTELATSPSDDVIIPATIIPELVTASVYIAQATLTETDRIVIRLEIKRTSTSTRSVIGYFGGNTPSHVHTSLGAPGGTGLVKVANGVIQAPATPLVNADVALDADIAVSKLSGTSDGGAANKVLHGSDTVGGEAVWGSVALGSDVSGQLPVPNGGTGLASGTAGGIPYFDTATSMASTPTLTENALLVGSSTQGLAPLATLGTTNYVLHGNATGVPSWSLVDLANDVTGTLGTARGGTGGSKVPVAGAVAYGDGTAYDFTLQGTAGDLLQSNGMSPPTWVSTLSVTQGGTGTNATVTDQVPYGNATADALTYTSGGTDGDVLGRLPGGGLGWITNTAEPTGAAGGDLSGNYPDPTVAKINGVTLGSSVAEGAVLRATSTTSADWGTVDLSSTAAVSGTLSAARGGTGFNTYAKGDFLYASAAGDVLDKLPAGADGTVLTVVSGAPAWAATGTVTSVGLDASTTGLTVNGLTTDTITSSGTFTLGGTLGMANGGTGNSTVAVSGAVPYSDGSKLIYTAAGTVGQALAVGATGLEWVNGLPPVGSATGDLSGTYPDPTVAQIKGAAVGTAGGALTTGNVLLVTGPAAIDYGTVNLASTDAVSGTLPVSNGGTGQTTLPLNSVVVGNDANGVLTVGPTSGNLMGWNISTGAASAISLGGHLTMTGNVLDTAGVGTIETVTLSTSTTGLLVNGATSDTLTGAGGTFTLSGTLAPGFGGTGNTVTPGVGTVAYGDGAKIAYTTAGTDGQPLLSNGVNAPAFGPLNLAGINTVTGELPSVNQAAQTLTGDVTGDTSAAVVAAIRGNPVQAQTLGIADGGKALVWTGSTWNAANITGGGGGGGGGLTYYFNYSNAGAAPVPSVNAKELSLNYDDVPTATVITSGALPKDTDPTPYLQLAQFITPLNEPGVTTIPPGIWEVGIYAYASAGDQAWMRAKLEKFNVDTLALTTLATSSYEQITQITTPALFTIDFFVASESIAENERLVITLEGQKTTTDPRTISLSFEGGTVSHIHTTLGAPGGTGVVKVADGVVQSPASLIINADIKSDAAIAVTKLDGGSGAGAANKVLHGGTTPGWEYVDLANDVTGNLLTTAGGTGRTSYAVGDMLYFASGTALSTLAINATPGAVLTSGAGSAPAYRTSLLVTADSVEVQKPMLLTPTVQSLTANTQTISSDTSYVQLNAAGSYTMASTPTISTSGVVAGTMLTLLNTGSNPIILQDESALSGTKIQLGGVASRALSQYTSIDLIFDGTYWVERSIGGSGTVQSVSATNGLITIGGTGPNPTVGISGLTSANPGTSGGIPYFSSTSQLGSSTLLAANRLMLGGGAGAAPFTLAAAGTSGQPLLSNGASAPAFGALDISTAAVTGTLPINKGGTGTATAPTTNGVIYGASGTAYASTAAGTDGQVLKGSTGNAPEFGALLASDIPSLPVSKITGIPYDVAGSVAVPNATEDCFFFVAVRSFTIEQGTHQARCRVAPSGGNTEFTLNKNGSAVSGGTFTILDGTNDVTFSITSTVSVAAGDYLTVTTGGATNGIRDVYFTFKAVVA